jgi:hypothetical protein
MRRHFSWEMDEEFTGNSKRWSLMKARRVCLSKDPKVSRSSWDLSKAIGH